MNRKMLFRLSLILLAVSLMFLANACAEGRILYDFEKSSGICWEVPEWCFEKQDYVCRTASISSDAASHGSSSLKLDVEFPGNVWRAAIAECEESVNLTTYNNISCDFYMPKGGPNGIRAKLALTAKIDSEWKWLETVRSVDLVPGRWITISASLANDSKDWMLPLGSVVGGKDFDPKVSGAQIMKITPEVRDSIEKIAVRIESNENAYKGSVYIDNITVSE